MKSNMPCPPAFIPVIRFDHATGLWGGMLVVSRRKDPWPANAEKFGLFPSAMNCFNRSGSMPSMPRMMSFWSVCEAGARWHPIATRVTPRHNNRRSRLSDKAVLARPCCGTQQFSSTCWEPECTPKSRNACSTNAKVDADFRLRGRRCQAGVPSGACGKLISQYLVPTQNVMLRQRFITFLMLPAGLLLAAVAFAAPKPNVILVTLDSVRADRVGFLGTASKTTPSLNAVARQSLVFEQAYAQAPLTVVSHATILSGTYPQTHQATEFGGPLAASVPVVADILRGQGYRTAAFVGSIELDPKNGLAPGFDRGFAEYNAGFHQPASNAARAPSYERRGSQVAARALTWINKSAAGPFFVWVNLHDADGLTASQYRMGVAACDTAVGTLVAALRSKKLYDNSLIIVVSAHGESLGAHGEQAHGIFLYDETVHVPLLIKLPGNQDAGKRVRAKVGLTDVAPTLLEVAGVPVPAQMQGQSLLRIAKSGSDQPVYSRSDFPQRAFGWSSLESWRAGKYLYIRAPHAELYDVSADPGATHNLAQSSKAIADTMASQLSAFDRRFGDQAH